MERIHQVAGQHGLGQYCDSFSGKLKEGTFALAHFYQRQINHIPREAPFRPNVAVGATPVAHRTRGRMGDLEAGVKKLSFETPTKPPRTPESNVNTEYDDTPPEERSYGPTALIDLNYPRTKDEQIVNVALIDFLNALIIHFDFPVYWTLYRKPFIATFEQGSFEARTDGCLEGPRSTVHAIVEVKPMLRSTRLSPILMQEAAEMVAWIKNEPDPDGFGTSCGRRVLVSQDRHEIYLVFAEYSETYVKI